MRSTTSSTTILCALACSLALGSCIESRRRKPGERAAKTEKAEPAAVALVLDPAAVDGKLDALVEGERTQALYDADDAFEGAREPLVTIIEYSDFECPFCGRFANSIGGALAANPDDVRLVFKQFPLPMHARAEPSARAALAAHAQGQFWGMHDRLFLDRSKLGDEDFERYATELGLDLEKFRAAMKDEATQRRVLDEANEGRVLNVQSTPTFFVNGRKFEGAKDAEALAQIIDEEKLAAQKLIAAGAKRSELYAHFMHAAQAGTGAVKPVDPTHKRGEASRVPNYAVPVGPGRPTRGPDDALVTIVEFGAFGCAACGPAHAVLAGVLDKHPEVRHAFRQLPDASSEPAARASIAAAAQGKFWELHDALATAGAPTDAAGLRKLAGARGLELARYDSDLGSEATSTVIKEDRAVADKVRGTAASPLFFVNGRFLPAEATAAELEALITEERGKAETALKERNVPAVQLYESMRSGWRGFAMVEEAAKGQLLQPGGVAKPGDVAPTVPPSGLGAAPVRGDAGTAKVTIVACTDFDCPACARGAKGLAELRERYRDKLAIEFRHYAPNGRKAGELANFAAIAAGLQGKFWELHDRLYENHRARSEVALAQLATDAGLDVERWQRDRVDPKLRARIDEDNAACAALGITSLPSYAIDDIVVRGAQPTKQLAEIIDARLAK
jgi:protein-disulfide isomerase